MTLVPDVLLMGVSGSGKSTVGKRLAEQLGSTFLDADDFHPVGNVVKMAAGNPLTDEDRMPWLQAIAAELGDMRAQGKPFVLACSALKQAYRELLLKEAPDTALMFLKGSPELIRERLSSRKGHFMTSALLDSQFEALEAPADSFEISIDGSVESLVAQIVVGLGLRD
jgi:carbohydrate kinase (thermoresistant glucokinase family)